MISPNQLLLVTLILPLVGAAIIALGPRRDAFPRQSALVTSVLTLLAAGMLVAQFRSEAAAMFAATSFDWLGGNQGLSVRLSVGLDGLSLWLFALSALLVLTSVLVSWQAIRDRPASFYALLLILETGMLGVFAARDIILFYVFFEFTLIPLFFLIGVWGSEERRYAAMKFFIYTLAGSMLTFVGLLSLILWCSQHPLPGTAAELTFSIAGLTEQLTALREAGQGMPLTVQLWIFFALFAGFAIKVPLFPLHTWLPLAHVQAPTAGSVLLAGVLLKIGTYGFLRFNLPMLPDATAAAMPYLLWISTAGILYGALVALAQSDIKRLIAYSSVSHLGFCMLGLFALNPLGIEGGTLQMINHGLSTGGLFACVGMLYERYHTRRIRDLGGLAKRLPVLAFFLLVFTLSSIGLPGLNGFAGEFLLLAGMFQRAFSGTETAWQPQLQVIAVLAVLGVVLGAWYMLWLYERTFFGPLREPQSAEHEPPADLSLREVAALAPLVVFIVWIGIRPETFLEVMRPALAEVTNVVQQAYEAEPSGDEAPPPANVAWRTRENARKASSLPGEIPGAATPAAQMAQQPQRRQRPPPPPGWEQVSAHPLDSNRAGDRL